MHAVTDNRRKSYNENRERYGLFSFLGTIPASPSYCAQPRRNADGTVRTAPRNFYTSRPKRGKSPDALFSAPLFLDSATPEGHTQKRTQDTTIQLQHWNPGKGPSTGVFSRYLYIEHREGKQLVRPGTFEPRNFYTNPPKALGKHPEFIEDPYGRKEQFERQHSKMLREKCQETPFRPGCAVPHTFSSHRTTYEEQVGGTPLRPRARNTVRTQHDRPFTVTRSRGPFGPYPEYVASPVQTTQKQPQVSYEPWRVTTQVKNVPSPSIVGNLKNLRTELSN